MKKMYLLQHFAMNYIFLQLASKIPVRRYSSSSSRLTESRKKCRLAYRLKSEVRYFGQSTSITIGIYRLQ